MDFEVSPQIRAKAVKIKLLILDVDGVLTDGKIWLTADGQEIKCFDVQDGVGIKQLHTIGVTVAVITGRNSAATRIRMQELGISHYYCGQDNKITALYSLLDLLKIDTQHIAYAGDDLPDIPPMEKIGLAIAVANSVAQVKKIAHWITEKSGGKGAVREICDVIFYSKVTQAKEYNEPVKNTH